MTPDQQVQCQILARLYDETPEEMALWWLDAKEEGSTWPLFFADMLEYAPRRVTKGTVRRRVLRGWTLEEALHTPPREYPASQAAERAAAGAASRGNLRKAREVLAAARSLR